MRRIVLGSAALSLVLAFGACGTDDPKLDRASISPTSSPPSTESTTSSEPSTVPQLEARSPEEYAGALIDAWSRNDRTEAEAVAVPAAVDTLFAYESGPEDGAVGITWDLVGCEGAAGSSYCTFNAGGDPTIVVRVLNEAASTGAPQAITEVRVES